MARVYENWERLVRATLRREQLRQTSPGHGRTPSGIAGSVPDSLQRTTNINAILQAADEIQDEDPNVARILCEQAYSMAQNLDPNSDGRGVLQFKTGLMSVIKQKLAKKEGARIDRNRDIERLWEFYQQYKRRHKVDDIRREEQKWRESGAVTANLGELGLRFSEMRKVFATLRAVVEVMESLSKDAPPDGVGRLITEELRRIKKSDTTLSAELAPYNIVPLEAPSLTNAIGFFPEVQGAISAIKYTEQFPQLPAVFDNSGQRDMDMFDLLEYVFGFQKDNIRNQRENVILIVANAQSGLGIPVEADPKIDENVITEVFLKVLDNYIKWCRYLRIRLVWNKLEAINRDRKLFLVSLYFCIWGEAANVRFLPECICYIFHHMARELDAILDRGANNCLVIIMTGSRLLSVAAMAAAAAIAATSSSFPTRAYADSPFRFYPFSSETTPPPPQTADTSESDAKDSTEDSRGGFNPESLERGAKALREINSSPYHKQVFDVMRQQEKTRLADIAAEKVHFEAIQAQADIDKQRQWGEDQRNLYQQQSQAKAQMLRYEDELARKRMQTDHEAQRRHNAELVKMQEESSLRKEQARRATEDQIQAQQRQTEKERAEIERETIRVKAMAEAEGRAHEAKLTEDHKRRMLIERINGEREKWLAAINTTFSHVEEGFRILLNDRSKLVMTVGGVTALAAGVYTTREGARVTWGYINRILGQPSLIRESSMSRFPWSGMISQVANKGLKFGTAAGLPATGQSKSAFGSIILHPSLQRRIEHLAKATANTKTHQAPFRNMLFYGPPGTGKTMVAREIARKSGLEYAMMTGGDVAPLGAQAVTKIHEIFDWAKKSNKGLLLFIDEADAFLCERNSTYMSEAQRSALNALLFRTGDQSRDVVLVLATNRPGDLDSAVTDRIDEVIEFPLPQEVERFKLLKLYLNKYLAGEGDSNSDSNSKWGHLFKKSPQRITIKDLSDDVIREAAKKTDGFSGREIAKLVASVQATVYGSPDCVLDSQLFKEIVDYKVAEHHQRIKLAAEGVERSYQGK